MQNNDISANKNTDSLDTARRLQETFIAVASNKFLNPIIAIKWNLEVLLASENLDEHTVEKLEDIRKNIQKLDDITKLMVRIYEVATTSSNEAYQVVDLNKTIKDIMDEFKLLIDQNNIIVELDIEESVDYALKGTEVFIREIIRTVIENAIYYNKIGGKIKVAVHQIDENVVIDVLDSGIGIPENEKDLIFNPFYRGSNVMKLSFKGNGLCLYFVKLGMSTIGGNITFDSTINKGTVFHLSFPVKK